MCLQIFPIIKFRENLFNSSRAVTRGKTDEWRDANTRRDYFHQGDDEAAVTSEIMKHFVLLSNHSSLQPDFIFKPYATFP
jgi:hypothetical protein